jgi:hypothetical protein
MAGQQTTNNKMNLDRHNYEEYFILYLDNELDSESRREVENFAHANPDLKAELDMLIQSKLSPDIDIVFNNKESLLIRNSSMISLANYEEWLISYVDNELTREERKDVESFAAAHPAVQKELDLFQKTKLQPEAIIFPYKESLYREEEKAKVISIRWWRIAAAAVLLLGISTTAIIFLNNKKKSDTDQVAKTNNVEKKATNNTVPDVKQPETTQPGNQSIATAENDQQKLLSPKENDKAIAQKNNNEFVVKEKKEKVTVPVTPEEQDSVQYAYVKPRTNANDLPKPTRENRYANNQIDQKNIITIAPKDNPEFASLTKNKENPAFASVTDQDPQPSYSEKTSNKGIRGFLRKVTRTFEKRTNIKATDDDDRLLIAGLAIKLN